MKNKIKNFKIIYIISIAFLIILFILIPYFIFFYILHSNNILKKYFDFIKIIPSDVLLKFTNTNLLNDFLIFDLSYIALGMFACAIISNFFYIYCKKYSILFNNIMILIGTIIIISFLLCTCLLFSFSEYYYDLFIQWCDSLGGNKNNYSEKEFIENIKNIINSDIPNQKKIISLLINLITDFKTNNKYPLLWISFNHIWWITGIQIVFIVFIMLKVGFKLELLLNNNIFLNKKEELFILKDIFNQNRFKKFISLYLIPNEFNISLWVIFFSSIVFIPQFIYTIIIGSSFTNANKFFLYSYFYPQLKINVIIFGTNNIYNQPNIDYFNMAINMPGSEIFINIMPIIFSALIISMLFAFTFIILKKTSLSKKCFFIFYVSFLIIFGISIIMFLISQYELAKAVDYWNSQSDNFKKTVMKPIFKTENLNYFWLQGNELLSSGILLFSFITVLSIIAFSHISKIKNNYIKN